MHSSDGRKEAESCWEAAYVLGAGPQMFWDPWGHLLLCTNPISSLFCQVLNPGIQASVQHTVQPTAATSSVSVGVTTASTQDMADASSSRHLRSLPTRCQSVFRVSKCFSFLGKWNKSHFGSSWLLEWYAQCPVPGSVCRGVLTLEGYFSICWQKLLYLKWISKFSNKESSGWYVLGH